MERFGVSSTVALLPLSLYVLAIGFGPIIGAPLSETYGRHVVYLASPPIAALFTLGTGFSQNFASLAICRFFAGLFFSPALAIGAGSNADVFHIHERAIPTVFYIISPFLGPSLGPTIGGFVTVRKGWQWTQWTIIFFAIFGWVAACGMSETHKGTILSRRNKSLGIAPPPSPFKSTSEKIHFLFTVTLFRPLHMLFTEPLVGFFSLYTAFNFGVLYTFFASFPYVFGSVYHFNVEQSGLVFLAMGIGSILGLPTIVILNKRYYLPAHAVAEAEGRIVAPEHRLYPAMIGSIGMPLGLFWFAWTARSDVSWVSPVMAAIPFAWANLVILMGCATYLVDTYQALNGASALAANGILRYGFGAAFPLFALQSKLCVMLGSLKELLRILE
jgi:MFS family permease